MNFGTSEKVIVKYKIHTTHSIHKQGERESRAVLILISCFAFALVQFCSRYLVADHRLFTGDVRAIRTARMQIYTSTLFFIAMKTTITHRHTHTYTCHSFTNVINAINNNKKSSIYIIFHSCTGYNQLNKRHISMVFIYLKLISKVIQSIWTWSNQQ